MKGDIVRRKTFLLSAALACVTLAAAGCAETGKAESADAYPSKPITIIVPFGAGGSTDVEARILAKGLSDELSKPVSVVNAPGGGTAVGLARVLNEPADGYTLFYQSDGYLADLIARKQVESKLDDLQPVALLGGEAVGLFARADAPFKTLEELTAHARKHPGKLTVAGTGAVGVMADTLISYRHAAGVDLKYIPTEGGSETVKNVLGGHADLGIVTASVYDDYEKKGDLRTLAISAEGDSYPPVPTARTFASLGYQDTVFYSNRGVYVKAGTDEEIVKKLADTVLKVAATGDWTSYAEKNAHVPNLLGPEEFEAYLRDIMPRYEKVAGLE